MRLISVRLRGTCLLGPIASKKQQGFAGLNDEVSTLFARSASGLSSAWQCSIRGLELRRWHIAQTGMEALGSIHLLNELLQIGLGGGLRLILFEIHLLLL